jgi:hypothetical protein
MFVHPHEEMHPIASQAAVPRDAIGAYLLQRMAQMGVAIGVVYGRGQVKLGHFGSSGVITAASNLNAAASENLLLCRGSPLKLSHLCYLQANP